MTGIVVKGGHAFNVYEPGKLGLSTTPPWTDLRAPVTGQNDNIPQLSHWFVCGVEKTTTTSTTVTTTSRTPATTTTATTSPTSVGTTAPESSAGAGSSSPAAGGAVATTPETPKAVSQNAANLAHTGFDGGWLIGLGAALVLGGAALVFLVRARRKA
ncbi:hypothetical protein GCM10017786_03420 [Amycolatopsis deserti]|uniref:Gram-positive cocci surface proteins LPxTG domain-containing protein n=1 Tax=Amycolatopsis deserti TaxID=185696 RepID=A0ABQ3IE22_9PSEU|nr:hypothetical protein GCM10017786_03420 [Amycolatopsis deserti]